MNLTDLEAFVAVVDNGSVVAAAARMHLTQSAVSRRIQNLEDVLGVPLLDRNTRPVQPTRAGKETYEFAKPVLGSVNDLKAAIIHNGETAGDFRFGVTRGLGDLALTGPIERLREKSPKLKIQAFTQWSTTLIERLQNRSLDAAVVLLPDEAVPPANLAAQLLGSEAIEVIAAKSVPLPRHATPEQISAYSWILNPHGCVGAQAIETAMLQRGLPLMVAIEAEGYDLQLSLVSQGVGLGLISPRMLRASQFRKNIKVVKVKGFSVHKKVWTLHPQHVGRLAPAIECLSASIKELLTSRSF